MSRRRDIEVRVKREESRREIKRDTKTSREIETARRQTTTKDNKRKKTKQKSRETDQYKRSYDHPSIQAKQTH